MRELLFIGIFYNIFILKTKKPGGLIFLTESYIIFLDLRKGGDLLKRGRHHRLFLFGRMKMGCCKDCGA